MCNLPGEVVSLSLARKLTRGLLDDAGGVGFMNTSLQDIRFGMRMSRKNLGIYDSDCLDASARDWG